jgi:hypothetical protein
MSNNLKLVHLNANLEETKSNKLPLKKDPEYLAQLRSSFINNHNKRIRDKKK